MTESGVGVKQKVLAHMAASALMCLLRKDF